MTHVRYKNTFGDVLWFSAYTYSHSPVLLVLYAGFTALVCFSTYNSLPASESLWARVLITVVMSLVILLILFLVIGVVLVLSLISRANRTILTHHTITLGDTGLTEETDFNRTEQKWAGIPRLVRTRRHIFAYVSQYGAHVIPRRAFDDAGAWNSFYEELRSRIHPNA